MLLKVGLATVAVSLVLAAGVAATVGLRGGTTEPAISTESRATAEPPPAQKREFDPGQRLEIDDEVHGSEEVAEQGDGNADDLKPSESVQAAGEAVPKDSEPASSLAPRTKVKSAPTSEPVPDWPEPTSEQVTSTQEPRHYQPQPDADMALTVEALGLYDVPVLSSSNLEALDRGLMHEPETSLPWDGGAQRNVFIAGHYLGWPGTESHLVFYNLDKLRRGDEIVLKDKQGRAYRYRVGEAFEATPEDSWVMGQERGRDMLTLQTCVPPTFEDRLVVRADRA